ncbi:hypothetical protein DDE82_008049 [Stemphylium lycopersici]|nr:hypothetical protein DDE82_008049 [Stemphylium lycopersici]
MTAPPAERSFFPAHHMQCAYPSPASTVDFDTNLHWSSMSPCSEIKSSHRSRKTQSSSPTGSQASDGAFRWIVGSAPDDFKSKDNMHVVRQTAMASYLNTGKSQGGKKLRTASEVSEKSPSSGESQSWSTAGKKRAGKKQASPTKTPLPTARVQKVPKADTQVAKTEARQSILPRAPIVIPVTEGFEYPFDKHPMPPLRSLGKNLDPFRTMFQSSNPRVSVEELKFHCAKFFGTQGLGRYWIPTCLNYAHTFLSTLYLAAAHNDVIKEREIESLETAALRQDIMHLVGTDLLDPQKNVGDPNIIAVSQLIIGEVIARQEGALVYHEAGIESMIKHRGGLYKLGMEGRLASSVSWVNLSAAILRERDPREMYVNYCASRSENQYPPNAVIPESPLYCPHGRYITVKRSSLCSPETLKILEKMHKMIELFTNQSTQSHGASKQMADLYRQITTDFPSISRLKRTVLRTEDWRYEAIRIAAVVQATAIFKHIALSEALVQVAPSNPPPTFYTASTASRSNDSLVSALDVHYETPGTEYSTSPTSNIYSSSPVRRQSGFPFAPHRPSDSSTSSGQRPSIISVQSTSSEWSIVQRHPVATTTTNAQDELLKSLKAALERSNLSQCWGDMSGVILWIGLVMGAASRKSDDLPLKRYFSATTMRAAIMLCFEHPEAIHRTVLKMTRVVERLRPDGSGVARKRARA